MIQCNNAHCIQGLFILFLCSQVKLVYLFVEMLFVSIVIYSILLYYIVLYICWSPYSLSERKQFQITHPNTHKHACNCTYINICIHVHRRCLLLHVFHVCTSICMHGLVWVRAVSIVIGIICMCERSKMFVFCYIFLSNNHIIISIVKIDDLPFICIVISLPFFRTAMHLLPSLCECDDMSFLEIMMLLRLLQSCTGTAHWSSLFI